MIVAPFPRRSSRINLWASRYFNQHSTWQMSGAAANRFRKSLGLKRDTPFSNARKRRAQLTINAYSRYLAPQPADWGDNNHTVGFCFLDQDSDWQPPSDLQAFLAAGSAPIYIGFGSMTDKDPAALTQMVIEVAQQSTERFILSSGWAKLGDQPLPENVFKIGSTPHSWLFPQMAAAVHHGGAGSTGASLRAGLPTQIVPFFADQPYWGRRVFEVGVGPKPIKRWRLTAQKLAQSIELMMTDQGLRARAAEMGRNISAENGATRAATIIDSILA